MNDILIGREPLQYDQIKHLSGNEIVEICDKYSREQRTIISKNVLLILDDRKITYEDIMRKLSNPGVDKTAISRMLLRIGFTCAIEDIVNWSELLFCTPSQLLMAMNWPVKATSFLKLYYEIYEKMSIKQRKTIISYTKRLLPKHEQNISPNQLGYLRLVEYADDQNLYYGELIYRGCFYQRAYLMHAQERKSLYGRAQTLFDLCYLLNRAPEYFVMQDYSVVDIEIDTDTIIPANTRTDISYFLKLTREGQAEVLAQMLFMQIGSDTEQPN